MRPNRKSQFFLLFVIMTKYSKWLGYNIIIRMVNALEVEIYADVLFFVNFMIDLMLLSLTAFFMKKEVKKRRLLLSSVFGALFAVIIFYISLQSILNIVFLLLSSSLMIRILFPYKNLRIFIKSLFVFFIISFIFGGAANAFYYLSPSGIVSINNGIVYLNISLVSLLFFAGIAYFLSIMLSKVLSSASLVSLYANVIIEVENTSVKAVGFTDTGNGLVDVISGIPVIIAEFDTVKDLIPNQLWSLYDGSSLNPDFSSYSYNNFYKRFRAISYKGVWKNGNLLYCFKPDSVKVTTKDGITYNNQALIGVTNEKLSITSEYTVLLNPQIFYNKEGHQNEYKIKGIH